MKIAIIGWGSLLWDKNPFFDSKHGEWIEDGPRLPLEFSRISRSRGGILTPVVDLIHGASSPTAYCLSTRVDYMDTVCDLRQREGCLYKYIGVVTNRPHNINDICEVYVPIYGWMRDHNINMTIFTALQPNFQRTTGNRFSIPAAMAYLEGLPQESAIKYAHYMSQLPKFVTTPLLENIKNFI